GAYQTHGEPMATNAGVLEQHIAEAIAAIGTPHHGKHILVAIVIEVGKRHRMPLLQMSEAAAHGDVLQRPAAVVAQHYVWHQAEVLRVTGAEVAIEPTVIVDIPKVAAHRHGRRHQPETATDVAETTGAVAFVHVGMAELQVATA